MQLNVKNSPAIVLQNNYLQHSSKPVAAVQKCIDVGRYTESIWITKFKGEIIKTFSEIWKREMH